MSHGLRTVTTLDQDPALAVHKVLEPNGKYATQLMQVQQDPN